MRLSIRSKLILSVGVPLLVIYGGVIGVDWYRSRGVAQERLRNHLLNQVRTTATRLEYTLRGVSRTAERLCDDVATHENVPREFYWLLLQRTLERNRGITAACIAFEPAAGPDDLYQFAPLVERRETEPPPRKEPPELISRYSLDIPLPRGPLRSERGDYFNSDWYRQAVLNEKGVWSEPYHNDQGQLISTFAEPIYRDGGLLGVAALDVDVEWLQRIVDRQRGKDETVLLVSRNGRFLYHPQEKFVMSQTLGASDETIPWATLAKAMSAGGEEARRVETPRGAVWAVFTPIPSSHWSFAAMLPEESMLQPLRKYIRGEAAILLVALVLVMLVVLVMSLSLTRRLKRLTRAARGIHAGNLHLNVPGRVGNDEIGDAIRAFNEMLERMEKGG
ncbi:MAG: HAMP domain-containing protein [Phycisphaerae bacterium]|nr:HAMP domain-containing protein [Phycisphaerae bacterium]